MRAPPWRSGNGHAGRADKAVIDMPYTHAEIAQMIGASRETVSRLLRNFQTKGLLAAKRSTIHVEQMQKLKDVAQGE